MHRRSYVNRTLRYLSRQIEIKTSSIRFQDPPSRPIRPSRACRRTLSPRPDGYQSDVSCTSLCTTSGRFVPYRRLRVSDTIRLAGHKVGSGGSLHAYAWSYAHSSLTRIWNSVQSAILVPRYETGKTRRSLDGRTKLLELAAYCSSSSACLLGSYILSRLSTTYTVNFVYPHTSSHCIGSAD